MKHTVVFSSLLAISISTYAQELSDSNPIMRRLILQQSELSVGAGLHYGQTKSNGSEWTPSFALSYGLTEDLTIGPIGVRYAVIKREKGHTGLELTTEGGVMGLYETEQKDKSIGLGGGIAGKYIFNESFALTFDGAFVFWNEDERDNRQECRISVGGLWQAHPSYTVFTNIAYREFKDFVQSHSYGASGGVIWNLSSQVDLTLSAGYSGFDPVKNGYKFNSELEKQAGISATYRF